MDYTFYLWGNLLAVISIIVSSFVAFLIYKLSKQLSAREKYNHEIKLSEKINELAIYQKIILADVSKYKPFRTDEDNETYYKQGAELYTIIPEIGIQFILRASNDEKIPVGLVPFDWIEYIREGDTEDSKLIVVCKFKGVKWYQNFKSPFRQINYIYKNSNYKKDCDPSFMKFTIINRKN